MGVSGKVWKSDGVGEQCEHSVALTLMILFLPGAAGGIRGWADGMRDASCLEHTIRKVSITIYTWDDISILSHVKSSIDTNRQTATGKPLWPAPGGMGTGIGRGG